MSQAAGLTESERVDEGTKPAPVLPFISFGFALALVSCTIWANDLTSPALPAMKETFGLSAKGAGLIVSFLFIGRLLGNFPAVRLLETAGAPRTATMGALVLIAGASVNMLAPTAEVLYLGRVLQGVGVALLVNAGLRSILVARPGRGAAMTLYGIATTIGSVIGLVSSGFLTGNFGWRSIFMLSALLGAVLAVLPIASTRVARRAARPSRSETTATAPAVPVRTYLAPLAVNFLIFCNYSIWVILPLYAEYRFDATPEMTANLLLIITVMHLAAAVPVSRAIRRFGSATVLVCSVVLAVIGTVGALLAPSVLVLAIPLLFYGSGMVGSVNAAGDIVLYRGGAGSRAVGTLRQTSDLGLVIGPIAAGSIVDAFGYSAPFIAFPMLMVAAVLGVTLPAVRSSRRSVETA